VKKITQNKHENGVITPKDPTPRNPFRKFKSTKTLRKKMSERSLKRRGE